MAHYDGYLHYQQEQIELFLYGIVYKSEKTLLLQYREQSTVAIS